MILKKNAMILMAIFGFASALIAREDPFTPVVAPKDSIRPYYGETRVFDSAQIELPSSARLIKKIEVTFQNIDGSLQTRSIAVRGRIDWRMPLIISQVLNKNQITQSKNTTKTPPKATTPKKAESSATIEPNPKENKENIADSRIDSRAISSDNLPKSSESKETIIRESVDSAREMRIAGSAVADSQVLDSPTQQSQTAQNTDSQTLDSPPNTPQIAQEKPQNISTNPPQKTQEKQNKINTKQIPAKKSRQRPIAQEQNLSQDLELDIETRLSQIDLQILEQDLPQDSPSDMQDLAQNLPQKAQDSQRNNAKKHLKYLPYSIDNNVIFIRYNGNLIRHYIMQNPYRIVMDFEINTSDYRKNIYNINAPYFKRLRYGLHTNFLRMVLELDGSYVYDLEKRGDGVKINVK